MTSSISTKQHEVPFSKKEWFSRTSSCRYDYITCDCRLTTACRNPRRMEADPAFLGRKPIMDLLQSVLNAGGGDAVRQLAEKFGLSEAQAAAGISSLLPAIAGGVLDKAATPGSMAGLLSTLASGQHAKYADDPNHPDAAAAGTGVLNDLLGGAEAHHQVAEQAAQQTGISSDTLAQMLPVVASMAMGAMSKHVSSGDIQNAGAAEQASGLSSLVGPLLSECNRGTFAKSVLGTASKFFTRNS